MKKLTIAAVAVSLFVVYCFILPLQVRAEKITPFSLRATDGRLYDLAAMKDCPMLILYFFEFLTIFGWRCISKYNALKI